LRNSRGRTKRNRYTISAYRSIEASIVRPNFVRTPLFTRLQLATGTPRDSCNSCSRISTASFSHTHTYTHTTKNVIVRISPLRSYRGRVCTCALFFSFSARIYTSSLSVYFTYIRVLLRLEGSARLVKNSKPVFDTISLTTTSPPIGRWSCVYARRGYLRDVAKNTRA